MDNISLRDMLGESMKIGAGLVLGLSSLPAKAEAQKIQTMPKLKIVVVGAHPDDPETGCGGTIIKYGDLGHDVSVLYLTRGEAGIHGKTHSEAAKIRTKEAKSACDLMHAKPIFFGQIDGSTEISQDWYKKIETVLKSLNPDIVFTQWPVDNHRDHRIASILTYDAWVGLGKVFALYYYEVMSGHQSQIFNPTDYVDISDVRDRKLEACYQHVSQGIDVNWYNKSHGRMEIFRGMEGGSKYAEAFIRHPQSPEIILS